MMKNALKKRLKTIHSPFFFRISVKEVAKERIDGIIIMARINITSPKKMVERSTVIKPKENGRFKNSVVSNVPKGIQLNCSDSAKVAAT